MKSERVTVNWSDADQEWVATCPEFPTLSWFAASRGAAVLGLAELLDQLDDE